MLHIDISLCNNDWRHVLSGGHKCGMMWAHKILAKNLPDFNHCFKYNAQEIKDRGQSMSPSHITHAVYHKEPTLLIQFKRKNPGHQVCATLLCDLFTYGLLPAIGWSPLHIPPHSRKQEWSRVQKDYNSPGLELFEAWQSLHMRDVERIGRV